MLLSKCQNSKMITAGTIVLVTFLGWLLFQIQTNEMEITSVKKRSNDIMVQLATIQTQLVYIAKGVFKEEK